MSSAVARPPYGILVVLAVTLGACGDRSPAGEPVQVWLTGPDGAPTAVARPGAEPSPRGALEALTDGPTPAESERGLTSWFGPGTRDALRSVKVVDGRAIVDFDEDLPQLIPNAATSAGSTELLTALDRTVFQFRDVREVEYRMGESCDAFWNWLQRECRVVRR